MRDWYELSTMTSPEVGRALDEVMVALLPVGATEQHGPNLGLGTDYQIAHRLAQRVAAQVHPIAVVVPPLPFGLSSHHLDFPGTISVSSDSFVAVCLDVVRSLSRHGLGRFVFVNGHQGNQAILNVLVNKIYYDLGHRAAVGYLRSQAGDVMARHRRTTRWGHACEIETSVGMYLVPELVRDHALAPGELIEDYGAFEDNYEPHALVAPKSFAERTRNGAFGDATKASREAGEEIVGTAVDRIAAFVRDFARKPPPPQSRHETPARA
jgi:creatinine amidohydrolase